MAAYNSGPLYLKPTTINNAAVTGQGISPTSGGVSQFAAFNDKTNFVVFDVQTADVICTTDGSTPVNGTAGRRLYAGQSYTWSKAAANAAKFKAVGTTAFIWAEEFQQ